MRLMRVFGLACFIFAVGSSCIAALYAVSRVFGKVLQQVGLRAVEATNHCKGVSHTSGMQPSLLEGVE